MRSTTALLSLLASAASVPTVLAAPVPIVLVADWDSRVSAPNAKHQQVVATTPASADAVARILAKAATAPIDESQNEVVIDNRPYKPASDAQPSAVLATPRPIVTEYLMSLDAAKGHKPHTKSPVGPGAFRLANALNKIESVLTGSSWTAASPSAEQDRAAPQKSDSPNNDEALERSSAPQQLPASAPQHFAGDEPQLEDILPPGFVKMEIRLQRLAGNPEYPCSSYMQLRHDYNDMMVISLVAVFLLVIVAVELWDNETLRVRDPEDAPTGTIRLGDNDQSRLEKQPLSVQAFPVSPALSTSVPAA